MTRAKLIDLTLRNKLIHTNIESTRARHVRVIDEKSAEVYRMLAMGKSFGFLHAKGSANDEENEANEGIYVPPSDDAVGGVAARHLDQWLQTRLTPAGLQKKLLSLYYEGQTLEEEQGVNILFLALGFLEWRDGERPDTSRFAPLVLMPVELVRGGANSQFKLRPRSDDLLTNFSLQAWLKQQFALDLPSVPDDDDLDIGSYFAAVRALVAVRGNWRVHEDEIVLGFFSFSKFLLWRDLDPANWPRPDALAGHSVLPLILLREMMESGGASNAPLIADGQCLDEVFMPADLVHVADADSSQAIAIQEALSGRNLVIQGPPGTGKSQTITNLIAGAVKRGKSVLFIAEKMAALDVVHSRLVKAGIGRVCLELHSRKASKVKVLDQIRQSMVQDSPLAVSDRTFSELGDTQSALRRHNNRLHAVGPNGFSAFQLMGKMALLNRLRTPTPDFPLQVAADWSVKELEANVLRVRQLAERVASAGTPANHPWRGTLIATPTLLALERLKKLLDALVGCCEQMQAAVRDAAECLRAEAEDPPIKAMNVWCAALGHLINRPDGVADWLASDEVAESAAEIRILIDAAERLAELRPITASFMDLFECLSPGEPPDDLVEAWSHLATRPRDVDEWLASDEVAKSAMEIGILIHAAEGLAELRPITAGFMELFECLSPSEPPDDLAEAWSHLATRPRDVDEWLASDEVAKSAREIRILIDAAERLAELRPITTGFMELFERLCPGEPPDDLVEAWSHLVNRPKGADGLLLDADIAENRAELALQLDFAHRFYELRSDLSTHVIPDAFESNWLEVRKTIAARGQTFFRWFYGDYRNAVTTFRGICVGTPPKAHSDRLALLDRLIALARLTEEVRVRSHLVKVWGSVWHAGQTDWGTLQGALNWIERADVFAPRVLLRSREVFALSDRSGAWPDSDAKRWELISRLALTRRMMSQVNEREGLQRMLGRLWLGDQTDWNLLRAMLDWVELSEVFAPRVPLRSREAFALSDRSRAWPDSNAKRRELISRLALTRQKMSRVNEREGLQRMLGRLWLGDQTDWSLLRSMLGWIKCSEAFASRVPLRSREAFALSDQSGAWPDSDAKRSELISRMALTRQMMSRVNEREGLQRMLGRLWLGDQTDWSLLRSVLDWTDVARSFEPSVRIRNARELDRADCAAGLLARLTNAVADAKAAFTTVMRDFAMDEGTALPSAPFGDISAGGLRDLAAFWMSVFPRITEWPPIREDIRWLESSGCGALAERVFDGRINAHHLENMFRIAAFEAMWTRTAASIPEIEQTAGDQMSAYVARFRSADLERIRIAANEVLYAHTQKLPIGGAGAVGVLREETKKMRNLKPVRRLMEEAGDAIKRVKPVLLMSPLSVAQYLPPGKIAFDLCVIDEASQVRPEDALGAIARCRQVVVVGDDKQLPPSNFFNRMVSDDESADDNEDEPDQQTRTAAVKDIESILNLCSRFPERMLRWHYRSEHPSLIATSNRHFYMNQLMLPPSVLAKVGDDKTGLLFHKVREGGYDRGRTRRNDIEAEEVAQAVLRHARASPNLSLGIGTFSVSQRDAIRDRLEYLAAANPDLDEFVRNGPKDKGEATFIKNLENIQGDERDVIFISVGYGRAPDGRLAQTFGPVGQDGGERRLNVLITRARKRCEVFSSLIADDIRDEASTKPGVTALKAFLKLAKDGYADAAEATSGRFGSEIEESVALAIRDMGYDVRPQVGMAGFFVDLGVMDPHNPDRYILGIECDGTAYHSSVYSRDRDRLRQSILEARGWRMHRIWSVDWFYRQGQELEKLKAALEAAVEGKPLPDDARASWPTHQQVAESSAHESEQISLPALHGETDVDDHVFARPMDESGRRHSLAPYVLANFDVPERHNMQPHQLYPRRLGEIVTEIVKVEQPIHVEEVARRIAYLFGLQRAGSQINRTAVDGLYWAGDVLAKKGNFYRMANGERLPARDRSSLPSSATVRKPEYICPTEIAEAAREVLRWNLALDLDELVLETARALGFARTGPSIALAIKNAIEDELLGVGPALHRHAQLLAYPIKNAIEVETQGDVEIDHMGRIRLRAEGLPN